MKTKRVWCEEKDVHLEWVGWGESTPKFKKLVKKHTSLIRCKKCKKRFHAFTRECHDTNCWHSYLPKHKRTLKKSERITDS